MAKWIGIWVMICSGIGTAVGQDQGDDKTKKKVPSAKTEKPTASSDKKSDKPAVGKTAAKADGKMWVTAGVSKQQLTKLDGNIHVETDDVLTLSRQVRKRALSMGVVVVKEVAESDKSRPTVELKLELSAEALESLGLWLEDSAILKLRSVNRKETKEPAPSTLRVYIKERDRAATYNRGSFVFSTGGSSLLLLDSELGKRHRMGISVQLQHRTYPAWIQFQAFERPSGETRWMIAHLGYRLYSKQWGNGQRMFMNPYIDLGAGMVIQQPTNDTGLDLRFGLGAEVIKTQYIVMDLRVAPSLLVIDGNSALSIQSTLTAGIAF